MQLSGTCGEIPLHDPRCLGLCLIHDECILSGREEATANAPSRGVAIIYLGISIVVLPDLAPWSLGRSTGL
jgi:hypothetical protein